MRGDESTALNAEGPLGPCRPSVLNSIKKWNSSDVEASAGSNSLLADVSAAYRCCAHKIALISDPEKFHCAAGAAFIPARGEGAAAFRPPLKEETPMKIWNKPQVREQEVGLEVTSYLPAEIDII